MGEARFQKPLLSPTGKKWSIFAICLGLMAIGGSSLYFILLNRRQPVPSPSPSPTVMIKSVTALGRLEPQGEVIQLAPPPNMGGAKIKELFVREGQKVEKAQVIATLDNLARKKAAVTLAEKDIKVAESQLAIIKAGAKTGEIEAQEAEIARLKVNLIGEINSHEATLERLNTELLGEQQEQTATLERLKAELLDAERDYQRYQNLAEEGVISDSELDARSLKLSQAREQLSEAKAKLNKTIETINKRIAEEKVNFQMKESTLEKQIVEAKGTLFRIAEVREVDVQKAQAEVERAKAVLREAKTELDQSYVKSPIDGTILKIHANVGEQVDSNEGILELGKIEQMMVIAEVYESDIGKIQLGQKAIIKSENNTFMEKLTGTVQQIGLKVGKKDVLDTDPAADVDVRVVEVKILLDPESSNRVSGLTYAQVIAEILL